MNSKKVLVLALPGDEHCAVIRQVLHSKFGVSSVAWAAKSFPENSFLTVEFGAGGVAAWLRTGGETHDLKSFHVAWYRRPGSPVVTRITNPKVRRFCQNESYTHAWGVLATSGLTIVNDPECEYAGSRKALQLRIAAEHGFRTPRSLLTNNPATARNFIEQLDGPAIYKGFTQTNWEAIATRELYPRDLDDLDSIAVSPVIFQEKIPKGRDIRVNVFGTRIFSAFVSTLAQEAELDWRVDSGAKWTSMRLPDEIQGRVLAVLESLGLDYGCFDLRETPEGEFVFLEVNPSGQFLWVEVWTGQPLAEEFCAFLLEDRPPRRLCPTIRKKGFAPEREEGQAKHQE